MMMKYVAARQLKTELYTAFHNDQILQNLISDSIEFFRVSTFFETGTFRGDSLRYVAARFGDRLNYISCEINKDVYQIATRAVSTDQHLKSTREKIHIFNESSPECIRRTIEAGLTVQPVLFWLDAHWYTYWPLLEELKEILGHLNKVIIVIDDFKLPFKSVFDGGYDSCGGVDNDLAYIDRILKIEDNPSRYNILFPNYESKIAGNDARVRGYVAIFVNLDKESREFASVNSSLRNFYRYDAKIAVERVAS